LARHLLQYGRGGRLRDEIVECAVLGYRHNRVTFPVTSCSDYVSRQHPSLREMEETARILRTDAKRSKVGFVHSTRFRVPVESAIKKGRQLFSRRPN
jgi:hypothetical protein